MKKASLILMIGAILFTAYAIVMLVFNIASYASYISYYGAASVLMAVLEGFFTPAGWAFLLFGLSALLKFLGKNCCAAPKVALVNEAAIDIDEMLEDYNAEAEAADETLRAEEAIEAAEAEAAEAAVEATEATEEAEEK